MKWVELGMKLLPLVVSAVNWVEKFVTNKGQAKEDAAVEMVQSVLQVVEAGADRDLLDDAEVAKATREVIQAVVALQNIIAKKKAA